MEDKEKKKNKKHYDLEDIADVDEESDIPVSEKRVKDKKRRE